MQRGEKRVGGLAGEPLLVISHWSLENKDRMVEPYF